MGRVAVDAGRGLLGGRRGGGSGCCGTDATRGAIKASARAREATALRGGRTGGGGAEGWAGRAVAAVRERGGGGGGGGEGRRKARGLVSATAAVLGLLFTRKFPCARPSAPQHEGHSTARSRYSAQLALLRRRHERHLLAQHLGPVHQARERAQVLRVEQVDRDPRLQGQQWTSLSRCTCTSEAKGEEGDAPRP